MQCEVRAMSETNTRSGPTRTSDTLPKPGRVTEVCKEWIVHEDGALAYRLQKEEVEQHLTGNKSRNAIVRQDIPRARDEQKREEQEAIAQYHQMVVEQEERDAAVARQLALRIQKEEEERRRRVELHDIRVARQMQEKELRRQNHVSPPPPLLPPVMPQPAPPAHLPLGDVNSVGLPDVTELAAAQFRGLNVREEWPPPPPQQPQEEDDEAEDEGDFNEEEHRRAQELRDEELARLLQQQEERLSGQELDQLDRDRLMAIEAQDKELAKLLQERERAKARRARERAKQKALLRKQQEAAAAEEEIRGETPTTPPPHLHPHSEHETSPRHRHRYPDPEAIEVLSPGESPLPNIAMAIDPTYSPHSTLSSSYQAEFEEYDEGPVPPYMPIQGQRRTSSLEKKKKKQPKDGCKQQ